MVTFLKRFWSVAISLGGVIGFYFASIPLNLVWVFWLIIAVSVVVAGSTVVLPKLLTWATAVRDYPKLLAAAAANEEENVRLRQSVQSATGEASSQWKQGVEEGRREAQGVLLAFMLKEVPSIEAIDVSTNGQPILFAKVDTVIRPVGARYQVKVTSTGAIRGIVEVTDWDADAKMAKLIAVRRDSRVFWKHLAERAQFDSSPPPDVELVAHTLALGEPVPPSTQDEASSTDLPEDHDDRAR